MIRRAILLGLSLALVGARSANSEDMLVFAAASLTDAIDEVSIAFEAASGHSVTPVYASSSALARQIESGAPAHIFISASIAWMDYLEERELIDPPSRLDLLANSLVIIAPTGTEIEIDNLADLPELLGEGNRLSIGDPEHVPAGIYAAEALEGLGLWDELAGRTARMSTVRSALAIVERGETPLGIVYATDAAITENVEVVAALPDESHQPIVYPAAVIRDLEDGDQRAAASYLEFLSSDEAAEIFGRHGFLTVAGGS